jgi:predicted ester cyclase
METLRHGLLVTVSGYTPALVELFTDDVAVISPVLEVHGRDELVEQLRRRNQVFSDLTMELQVTELADDRLLGEWQFSAMHSGRLDLPGLNVPPTSRTVSVAGVAVADFLGSQIRELRQYWDALSLLKGLGLADADLLRSAEN